MDFMFGGADGFGYGNVREMLGTRITKTIWGYERSAASEPGNDGRYDEQSEYIDKRLERGPNGELALCIEGEGLHTLLSMGYLALERGERAWIPVTRNQALMCVEYSSYGEKLIAAFHELGEKIPGIDGPEEEDEIGSSIVWERKSGKFGEPGYFRECLIKDDRGDFTLYSTIAGYPFVCNEFVWIHSAEEKMPIDVPAERAYVYEMAPYAARCWAEKCGKDSDIYKAIMGCEAA